MNIGMPTVITVFVAATVIFGSFGIGPQYTGEAKTKFTPDTASEDTTGEAKTKFTPDTASEDTTGPAEGKPAQPSKDTSGSAPADVIPADTGRGARAEVKAARARVRARVKGLPKPIRKRVVGSSPAADQFAGQEAMKQYWLERAVRTALPDDVPAAAQPQSAADPNRTLNDQTPSGPAPPLRAASAPQAEIKEADDSMQEIKKTEALIQEFDDSMQVTKETKAEIKETDDSKKATRKAEAVLNETDDSMKVTQKTEADIQEIDASMEATKKAEDLSDVGIGSKIKDQSDVYTDTKIEAAQLQSSITQLGAAGGTNATSNGRLTGMAAGSRGLAQMNADGRQSKHLIHLDCNGVLVKGDVAKPLDKVFEGFIMTREAEEVNAQRLLAKTTLLPAVEPLLRFASAQHNFKEYHPNNGVLVEGDVAKPLDKVFEGSVMTTEAEEVNAQRLLELTKTTLLPSVEPLLRFASAQHNLKLVIRTFGNDMYSVEEQLSKLQNTEGINEEFLGIPDERRFQMYWLQTDRDMEAPPKFLVLQKVWGDDKMEVKVKCQGGNAASEYVVDGLLLAWVATNIVQIQEQTGGSIEMEDVMQTMGQGCSASLMPVIQKYTVRQGASQGAKVECKATAKGTQSTTDVCEGTGAFGDIICTWPGSGSSPREDPCQHKEAGKSIVVSVACALSEKAKVHLKTYCMWKSWVEGDTALEYQVHDASSLADWFNNVIANQPGVTAIRDDFKWHERNGKVFFPDMVMGRHLLYHAQHLFFFDDNLGIALFTTPLGPSGERLKANDDIVQAAMVHVKTDRNKGYYASADPEYFVTEICNRFPRKEFDNNIVNNSIETPRQQCNRLEKPGVMEPVISKTTAPGLHKNRNRSTDTRKLPTISSAKRFFKSRHEYRQVEPSSKDE